MTLNTTAKILLEKCSQDGHGQRYAIDFDGPAHALRANRLLVYTSPSNPLGWVADPQEQQALLDFCRRHRLWLLADDVYERIFYKGCSCSRGGLWQGWRRCGADLLCGG